MVLLTIDPAGQEQRIASQSFKLDFRIKIHMQVDASAFAIIDPVWFFLANSPGEFLIVISAFYSHDKLLH